MMLIDKKLMQIDADLYWLMIIDIARCWFICWLMMIESIRLMLIDTAETIRSLTIEETIAQNV